MNFWKVLSESEIPNSVKIFLMLYFIPVRTQCCFNNVHAGMLCRRRMNVKMTLCANWACVVLWMFTVYFEVNCIDRVISRRLEKKEKERTIVYGLRIYCLENNRSIVQRTTDFDRCDDEKMRAIVDLTTFRRSKSNFQEQQIVRPFYTGALLEIGLKFNDQGSGTENNYIHLTL